MADEQDRIGDRIKSAGGQVASGLADAVISSPVFGQAVSAAAAARDRAIEAQQMAREALNLSSRDEADRLERRLRVLSNRLEETEDRLDDALDELRGLRTEANRSGTAEPGTPPPGDPDQSG